MYGARCRMISSVATASGWDQRYRSCAPSAIGRNSTAMNGSVRLDASKMRRVTTPQAPPDRY